MANGRYERTIAICDEVLRGDADDRYAYALRGYAHLLQENETRQAIADFSEVIRRAPKNAVIHVARAQAYRKAKDYDRAIADCSEAIRIDPKYSAAYAWRGACYLKNHVTDKALADYSQALRHDPFLAWARCGRAEAFRRRGETARALADLEEVLRVDPDDEQARINRCYVYLFNRHDCDRAIAESSDLIHSSPSEPLGYALRGMAYVVNGEIAKGLLDGGMAELLKPGFLHFQCSCKAHSMFFGFAFGSSANHLAPGEDDPKERIVACTKRLASDPNNVAAYYERGWTYARQSDFKRALADYDQIIRLDPTDAEAYRQRGRAHHRLKAYAEAMDDYKNALRLDPSNADNFVSRAALYSTQKQYEKALHDYDAALRIDPRIAVAHDYRGWMYGHHRDYDQAIAEYTEALRQSPEDAEIYVRRAWVRWHQGKYEDGIVDYKQALQYDPKNVDARGGLAWLQATCPEARLRNGKEARENASIACEATSWRDPTFLDTLAAACAECGDFKEAVKWQTKVLELAPEKDKPSYRRKLELYRSHRPYHLSPVRTVSPRSSKTE